MWRSCPQLSASYGKGHRRCRCRRLQAGYGSFALRRSPGLVGRGSKKGLAAPSSRAARGILKVMVKDTVGADVEDFKPAIHVLPYGDLLGLVGRGSKKGLAAPSSRAARGILKVMVKDTVGADVEDFKPAIAVSPYGDLLGLVGRGSKKGLAAHVAGVARSYLRVMVKDTVGADVEDFKPAIAVSPYGDLLGLVGRSAE